MKQRTLFGIVISVALVAGLASASHGAASPLGEPPKSDTPKPKPSASAAKEKPKPKPEPKKPDEGGW